MLPVNDQTLPPPGPWIRDLLLFPPSPPAPRTASCSAGAVHSPAPPVAQRRIAAAVLLQTHVYPCPRGGVAPSCSWWNGCPQDLSPPRRDCGLGRPWIPNSTLSLAKARHGGGVCRGAPPLLRERRHFSRPPSQCLSSAATRCEQHLQSGDQRVPGLVPRSPRAWDGAAGEPDGACNKAFVEPDQLQQVSGEMA